MAGNIRHAAVLGGATGIGSGIVRALAVRGYHVHLCDIDEDGGRALAAELGPDRATFHRADVTSNESLEAVEQAIRASAPAIDLVFANAGAISLKPFLETTDDDWQWLMGINFFGTVKSLRAFLPGLVAQGSGRVVVTSSVAALRELPMPGQSMYMASKAAQFGLCNALQAELAGTGVKLSIIFPGAVRTSLRDKSEALRPGVVQVAVPAAVAGPGYIEPEAAGERIMAMIEAGRTYISTHPGEGPLVRDTQDSVQTAFEEDF